MTGREIRDENGYTTVNVRMPKSHWVAMLTIALTAVGGVGWSAHNQKAIEEVERPVSREWARNLSDELSDIKRQLVTVTRNDVQITEMKAQLDRIDRRLDDLAKRN